ncbi:flagellar biosynthesis protein FliR [soil metagenome]
MNAALASLGSASVLATFLIFCRIGSCLMVMPGMSTARVPLQIRLFTAIALSLALAPSLIDPVRATAGNAVPSVLLILIVTETIAGSVIGLLGRLFFLALQFAATAIANFIGISALPGVPIDEPEAMPALVSIITLTATALFFVTDQHWEMIAGLLASYTAWPVGFVFNAQWGLVQMTDQLRDTFLLALRVCAPFLIYTIIINLAIGLVNKLTPQIPVYFISMPFVVAGGLALLYFSLSESLRVFMMGFQNWIDAL